MTVEEEEEKKKFSCVFNFKLTQPQNELQTYDERVIASNYRSGI